MSVRYQGFLRKNLDLFTDEKKVEMERLIRKGDFALKTHVITDGEGILKGVETELRVKGIMNG